LVLNKLHVGYFLHFCFIVISGAWIRYGIVFNVPLDTVETGPWQWCASLIQQWRASDIIDPLTRIDFVYNGLKGMELAPNPRYSGGSYSSMRLI